MYSKLFILGNLGREPEMRFTPSGQAVTDMNVASNRVYTDSSGQKVTETTWYRVTAWGTLAENCNAYLHKGSKVFIEGRLKPDPETGGPRIYYRDDGTAGSSFEMTAQIVQFLDSKSDNQNVAGQYDQDLSNKKFENTEEFPF
jgi:single-strand DNA-binding protein